jgi:uroporphyrin-III C-methyltransferase/precorrin-2 dehydrogenase/sirohydrochlorin ferrochelatase
MEPDLSEAGLTGPALTFFGLAPRAAVARAQAAPAHSDQEAL